MHSSFDESRRALGEESRFRLMLAMMTLLIAAGGGVWLFVARVALYQSTPQARIEVGKAGHPIDVAVAGSVIESHLAVGRHVEAGENLVLLDARIQQHLRDESRVRRESLNKSVAAIRRELESEEAALAVSEAARSAAKDQAMAIVSQSRSRAVLADRRLDISKQLIATNAVSQLEYLRDSADAESERAMVRSDEAAAIRLDHDRALQHQERLVRIDRLKRELTDMAGSILVEESTLRRLDHEISLRTVKAPVSGVLGEVSGIRQGSVITLAQRIGTVIPDGDPRAIAWFPAEVVGKLQIGQKAKMRLDGYPWTQFGTVSAELSRLGNESIDGRIRVEFAVNTSGTFSVPLQHGMTGGIEVEVETVSPAELVLRAAGLYLAPRHEDAQVPSQNRVAAVRP
jgi:membrane fusion protein (multidrug efflux system)